MFFVVQVILALTTGHLKLCSACVKQNTAVKTASDACSLLAK